MILISAILARSHGLAALGFVIASLYYGEYGVSEPTASLDAIGVDKANRGQHVGKALLRQLRLNLSALRVTTLRTEVSWDDFDLLAFFKKEGFAPTTNRPPFRHPTTPRNPRGPRRRPSGLVRAPRDVPLSSSS